MFVAAGFLTEIAAPLNALKVFIFGLEEDIDFFSSMLFLFVLFTVYKVGAHRAGTRFISFIFQWFVTSLLARQLFMLSFVLSGKNSLI